MVSLPSRSKRKRNIRADGRLPRNTAPISVAITHIGGRGDGVGTIRYNYNHTESMHNIFIPASLPGETAIVQPLSISNQGIKARIIELDAVSPFRQTPQCHAFPACGGCSFQHWTPEKIEAWKIKLITTHLNRPNVTAELIRPIQASPNHSRRRACFHIKRLAKVAVVGFRERMSEHIVNPDGCTVIAPELARLKDALIDFTTQHLPIGATLDAQVNLLSPSSSRANSNLCVYLQNTAAQSLWTPILRTALCSWANEQQFSRLSIDDQGSPLTLYAPTPPQLTFGPVSLTPPPGTFLQATHDGEKALQAAVSEIIEGNTHVVDLFAGCGTLSLPIISRLTRLLAVEADKDALAALKSGVDAAELGSRLNTLHRDLLEAPLMPEDLKNFTAVILDPPRSGAAAQCQQLAKSAINTIAMISCNPASFARDAAHLISGGFQLDWVQPIDQFTYSNHLEIVGAFRR